MPADLLAAMLQRVEAKVRELGDFLAGGVYAKDATCVLRALFAREQVVAQAAVAPAAHVLSSCPTLVASGSAVAWCCVSLRRLLRRLPREGVRHGCATSAVDANHERGGHDRADDAKARGHE